jgi:hypothetical protein
MKNVYPNPNLAGLNKKYMETITKRSRVDIQKRDIEIFQAIAELKYATVEQVAVLFPSKESGIKINPLGIFRGGAKAIANRLSKLTQHGYLQKIGWPFRRLSDTAIYTISEETANLLIKEKGYNDEEALELKALVRKIKKHLEQRRQSKHFYIDHRLGINNFRIALILAIRANSQIDWGYDRDGNPTWDESYPITIKMRTENIPDRIRNHIKATGSEKTIIRTPDALFRLSIDGHKILYLYEFDTGSEIHTTVATKLYCYYQWYKRGMHKSLGSNHLRVLVETYSEKRLENIISSAALPVKYTDLLARQRGRNAVGSGIFWLTTEKNIDIKNPERILDPIWTVGQSKYLMQRYSMVDKGLK